MDNSILIQRFYSAFQERDFKTMQSCYHKDAVFSDPVFQNLGSDEVKGMWQMLLTSAKDLKIEFSKINSAGENGSCHWEAGYTFTTTGRKVHNVIDAEFVFKDGLIYRHKDHFDFWRWSRMALGMPGMLLGWSPIIKNKVSRTAKTRLEKFLKANG
jgi:ketosteroid isomerase-like protein